MLLGAPGIGTRSKDATRGSWHRYEGLLASLLGARMLLAAPGIAAGSKDATSGSWHRF